MIDIRVIRSFVGFVIPGQVMGQGQRVALAVGILWEGRFIQQG